MMNKSDTTQIEQLIGQLGQQDGLIRQQARIALVRIGEPAVGPLIEALENRTGYTHWEAAKALSQIGSPQAAQALVEALQDDEFSVRWLAAEGLIAISEDSLKPLLTALVNNPQSALLREGAHHVLHDLVHRLSLKPPLRKQVEPVLAALNDIEPAVEVPPVAEQALHKLSAQRTID
jgi:hypothetical protein